MNKNHWHTYYTRILWQNELWFVESFSIKMQNQINNSKNGINDEQREKEKEKSTWTLIYTKLLYLLIQEFKQATYQVIEDLRTFCCSLKLLIHIFVWREQTDSVWFYMPWTCIIDSYIMRCFKVKQKIEQQHRILQRIGSGKMNNEYEGISYTRIHTRHTISVDFFFIFFKSFFSSSFYTYSSWLRCSFFSQVYNIYLLL